MRDRLKGRQQLDLLVDAANALDESLIPPPIRAEVRLLLRLLMAERLAADTGRPVEAGDE
jgi:hypothetical protein